MASKAALWKSYFGEPAAYAVSAPTPGDIKITGYQELLDELTRLPLKLEKRAVRNAAMDGARIMREQARSNVDVIVATGPKWERWGQYKGQAHMAGMLRKKIRVIPRRMPKTGQVKISAGVGYRDGVAYGIPLEYGHRIVIRGRDTGRHAPAYPWLRQVIRQKQSAIIDAVRARLTTEIARYRPGGNTGT